MPMRYTYGDYFYDVADFSYAARTFYGVLGKFFDAYKYFKEHDTFLMKDLDELEIDLAHIKDRIHTLFRKDDEEGDNLDKGVLFDLAVGTVFHELLHVKEYVYTMTAYAPRYQQLSEQMNKGKGKDDKGREDARFLLRGNLIVSEATRHLPRKADELYYFFKDAQAHLERLIAQYKEESRLLRGIYFDGDILAKVYGRDGPGKLYSIVFDSTPAVGYLKVGESFLSASFFDKALEAFKKAMRYLKAQKKKKKLDPNALPFLESVLKKISVLTTGNVYSKAFLRLQDTIKELVKK